VFVDRDSKPSPPPLFGLRRGVGMVPFRCWPVMQLVEGEEAVDGPEIVHSTAGDRIFL
jgi:hypothetical protein